MDSSRLTLITAMTSNGPSLVVEGQLTTIEAVSLLQHLRAQTNDIYTLYQDGVQIAV